MKTIIFSGIILLAQVVFAQTENFEIDLTTPPTVEQATTILNDFLKNSKVAGKEYFCISGDLTCRTHYVLNDLSGNGLSAFYVKFVAVDRSVGSQGYFFKVKGSVDEYVRFEDFSFDGKISVDKVELTNIVKVEKDSNNQITSIKGLIAPVLGTTKYVSADLIVTTEAATLKGTRFDSSNPQFSEPVELIYKRASLK